MEFINAYTVQSAPIGAWIAFGILILSFLIGMYMLIFVDYEKKTKTFETVFLSIIFVVLIFFSALLFSSSKIHYEVKVDEKTSVQELTEDWTIIEQKEDNIFVLERKNEE